MNHAKLLERPVSARLNTTDDGGGCEAAEITRLLARAGVDHASALWFQLLELATRQAGDWSERAAAAHADLSPRSAALLGLRALAAEILSAAPGQADDARHAAAACLDACAEAQAHASPPPPRRRRWGEGAETRPPQRPGPLQGAVGCC